LPKQYEFMGLHLRGPFPRLPGLILVDDMGQVCLVEVKKEGNPNTRQVLAQLFEYAASL
jgi:hypothetical protein